MKQDEPYDLKILMTADTVGGVWTYAIELCKALQPYKVFVHLVTMGEYLKPGQQQQVSALHNVELHETAYALEWMHSPWNDIEEAGKLLLQLEKQLQPDVIHLNCFSHGNLRWQAPVLIAAHSDVYTWWKVVKGELPPAEWREYYTRVKAGLAVAHTLVAPSAFALKNTVDTYEYKGNAVVIYNGCDAQCFGPTEKQYYVFSMGRVWDEAKNIQLLIDASAQVSCPIRIAGENNFDNNHLEVETTHVQFVGRLETAEIARQLSAAAIAVFPSRYEPFGLAVLEAALSGCALVLGDIPSFREIWKDKAIYVDTNDSAKLADAINSLVENEGLRKEMACKVLSHARQYSSNQMAMQYHQQYLHLVQNTQEAQKQIML